MRFLTASMEHACFATASSVANISTRTPTRCHERGVSLDRHTAVDNDIPSDNRFVASLSTTSTFSRTNAIAVSGTVEVLEADAEHVAVTYDLHFYNAEADDVSGTASAMISDDWEHSWLGIPRTSPTEPRN